MLKFINRNSRKKCGICLKVTIKHQNDIFLSASIVDFKKVNVCWALNPSTLKTIHETVTTALAALDVSEYYHKKLRCRFSF